MENENLDLDVKPAGNKDLWLFLIIVDIIFLCVFGFFIYKHFSARLFETPAAAVSEQTQTVNVPEITETDIVVSEEPIVVDSATVAPVSNAETPAAIVEAPKAQEVKPAEAAPAVVAQPEKKESVLVKVNPKSKYRRVTFRWFGEGEKVSIVSGFTMAKPQALRKRGDYWETTLSIAPGAYKFLYIIDGKNTLDPYSEEKDGRSYIVIE